MRRVAQIIFVHLTTRGRFTIIILCKLTRMGEGGGSSLMERGELWLDGGSRARGRGGAGAGNKKDHRERHFVMKLSLATAIFEKQMTLCTEILKVS